MLHILFSLGFVGMALASPTRLLEPRQTGLIYPALDAASYLSCLSLLNSCNATYIDLDNFYSYVPCIMLTTCLQGVQNPVQVLSFVGAPSNQSRLTEETFYSMSNGNAYMTQQNYIDAYYGAVSQTPNGTYPDSVVYVQGQWEAISAWTGFCDTVDVPYSNFADWLEYSSAPGVCGAVSYCEPTLGVTPPPCVPQPITDNGSCAEMVTLCSLWDTELAGLFQNEYCVLASFCYAWSNTDVLIQTVTPQGVPVLTSLQEIRLSEAVFYNMTGGASTMSQHNVIDAYYGALTGTNPYTGPSGGFKNGPYPTSTEYVIDFWAIISAWAGFCDTREIPYSNLADYLSYAAENDYHPTC